MPDQVVDRVLKVLGDNGRATGSAHVLLDVGIPQVGERLDPAFLLGTLQIAPVVLARSFLDVVVVVAVARAVAAGIPLERERPGGARGERLEG